MGDLWTKSETELARLGDGELIEYAIERREAGDREQAELALKIFAFGMEGRLRAFVQLRLGSHPDVDVEEVAGRALEDAIRSIEKLRGRTEEEARAFVFKIARLRIADFHRKMRLETTPSNEVLGGEGPERQLVDIRTDGEADLIGTELLLEGALAGMRPDHREAARLFVLAGCSARETAEIVRRRFPDLDDDSMTEQNVHQIGSRFRKDLRAQLEQAEKGAGRP